MRRHEAAVAGVANAEKIYAVCLNVCCNKSLLLYSGNIEKFYKYECN